MCLKMLSLSAEKTCTFVHTTCSETTTRKAQRWKILLQNRREKPVISHLKIHLTTTKVRQQNKVNTTKTKRKKMVRQNVGENVALGKILLWNVMYTAKFAGKFQQLVTSPTFFQQMQTLP